MSRRFHLSTLMVAALSGAILLYLNVSPQEKVLYANTPEEVVHTCYGWPFYVNAAPNEYSFLMIGGHGIRPIFVILDFIALATIVVGLVVAIEAIVAAPPPKQTLSPPTDPNDPDPNVASQPFERGVASQPVEPKPEALKDNDPNP